ncbi:MAG TPA: sensor histidine kinase, partial [Ramlibacter sp.]|nr:sensor histidine kinase [Ramlibacter sp.]
VENAIKYTPEGGTIDLEVRDNGAEVEFVVEDSGPGIPVEERERVFDRFYRIAGSPAGGSGLGLAIIKSIAARHNATLTLSRSGKLGGLMATIAFQKGTVATGAKAAGTSPVFSKPNRSL